VKNDYEQIVENALKPASNKGFTNSHQVNNRIFAGV
jgi:hypothetical protein